MFEHLTAFIRKRIRNEILWKVFWIMLLVGPVVFFALLLLNDPDAPNIFLFFSGILVSLVLFISIPRWRKYYLTQYHYASKFAEALEKKTKVLTVALSHLNRDSLPKEVFWINFKVSPNTLKIEFETYSTQPTDHFEDLRNEIETLISVNESTIAELKMKGWDGEENIELYIEMIRMWIYKTWSQVVSQRLKIRSTISIKDRSGYFNMTSNRWEE
jgi:hypothetical protein